MKTQVYRIERGGIVSTLYKDDLPRVGACPEIGRASNVEPDPLGGWQVVLSDHELNGEHKGKTLARRVARREDALKIEVDWINRNILSASHGAERPKNDA